MARPQIRFSLDPGVERELRAATAEAGAGISDVANAALARAFGMDPPAPAVGGKGSRTWTGKFARSAIGRLADEGGWFTARQAMEAAGTSYAVTLTYLAELVAAGVLVGREVPGSRGSGRPAKEFISSEPHRQN